MKVNFLPGGMVLDSYNVKDAISKAYCALELKRKIVGIKLLKSKEDFDAADASSLGNKMNYCVLVKLTMMGRSFKAGLDKFGCLSSARSLGMIEAAENWLSGCVYKEQGMYNDITTSKKVVENTTNISEKVYGIMVKPIEQFSEEPDTVLIVTNPYNTMRLIQGYAFNYGTYKNFKMVGLHAFCSELTAYPYESGEINVSILCAGTRRMAGWGKDEMGIGIPYSKFSRMIEGLYETINIMEPNEDKAIIEQKIKKDNRNDLEIEYNKNYYTGLYLTGK